jgi:hypothetical protein
MRSCLGCGTELRKRSQLTYCSVGCQQVYRQRMAVQAWLTSGTAFPGTRPEHYVRRHLAEEQQCRCALCGRPDEWEGRPLVFVLDHVDGDAANNKRTNLRLVCPNCDSQLSTFKSRNRGRGRHARRQRYADGQSY